MKELVPKNDDPDASLDSLIESLKKYTDSPDLIVGIKLTPSIKIDFSKIIVNSLTVAQIWCFGSTQEDESKWGLFGDLLDIPYFYEYELPKNWLS